MSCEYIATKNLLTRDQKYVQYRNETTLTLNWDDYE